MEKSAGASPAKMMAAQIECAASKIKVDHCHSSYNHGNIIKTRMSVIRALKAAALALIKPSELPWTLKTAPLIWEACWNLVATNLCLRPTRNTP